VRGCGYFYLGPGSTRKYLITAFGRTTLYVKQSLYMYLEVLAPCIKNPENERAVLEGLIYSMRRLCFTYNVVPSKVVHVLPGTFGPQDQSLVSRAPCVALCGARDTGVIIKTAHTKCDFPTVNPREASI
jgi:hypothetical protein